MSMMRKKALNELLTMLARYSFDVDEARAIGKAMETLRPVIQEQIKQNKRRWEIQTSIFPYYYCSGCGESFEIHSYDKEKYRFCPYCMSPMTDEAVEIMIERLSGIK